MKHRYVFLHGFAALGISILYACTYEQPTIDNSRSSSSSSNATASSGSVSSSSGQGVGGGGGGGGFGTTSSSGIGGGLMMFPSVHCGEQGECFSPQACCTDQKELYSCGASFECEANQQLAITCDGPEDCPNTICCGRWNDGTSSYDGVYCSLKCFSPFVSICHFDEPDPSCPSPLKCLQEPILGPRYGYCGQ